MPTKLDRLDKLLFVTTDSIQPTEILHYKHHDDPHKTYEMQLTTCFQSGTLGLGRMPIKP